MPWVSTPHERPARFDVGVVGAGRVGAVLGAALARAGHVVSGVSAVSEASLERAATLLPGVPVKPVPEVVAGAHLVVLAVPDDALQDLVAGLSATRTFTPGQLVMHTSGAHGISVFEAAADSDIVPLAVHPAMTFTGTDVDLARLSGCVFGVTATEDTSVLAETLVGDLRGRVSWVQEERRALYHAGLAHGANHLVTLVAEAMDLLRASGSDDPASTLRPLLTAALDNALSYGDAALTGPIVRGDVETVRAHLRDIATSSPATLRSYVAMARATANRAVLDGRLLPIRAAKLVGVLNDAMALAVAADESRRAGAGTSA